jgi:hypothetical protein
MVTMTEIVLCQVCRLCRRSDDEIATDFVAGEDEEVVEEFDGFREVDESNSY